MSNTSEQTFDAEDLEAMAVEAADKRERRAGTQSTRVLALQKSLRAQCCVPAVVSKSPEGYEYVEVHARHEEMLKRRGYDLSEPYKPRGSVFEWIRVFPEPDYPRD